MKDLGTRNQYLGRRREKQGRTAFSRTERYVPSGMTLAALRKYPEVRQRRTLVWSSPQLMMGMSNRWRYLRSWVRIDRARERALKLSRCYEVVVSIALCDGTEERPTVWHHLEDFRPSAIRGQLGTRTRDAGVRTLDERVVGVESSEMIPLLRRELAPFEFSSHAVAVVEKEDVLRRQR